MRLKVMVLVSCLRCKEDLMFSRIYSVSDTLATVTMPATRYLAIYCIFWTFSSTESINMISHSCCCQSFFGFMESLARQQKFYDQTFLCGIPSFSCTLSLLKPCNHFSKTPRVIQNYFFYNTKLLFFSFYCFLLTTVIFIKIYKSPFIKFKYFQFTE